MSVAGKTATTAAEQTMREPREPVLDVVDRVSELLFGLLMALTFVGAISVVEAGRNEVRDLYGAALGCNLAWGLVDAVMHLVRTITERGRALTLVRSVRAAPDATSGAKLIRGALSPIVSALMSDASVEGMRERMLALTSLPRRPTLRGQDLLASLSIFLIVVASTFPVVLPFALIQDVGTAKSVSRVIALVMLFVGGLALGRYAGYGSWKVGLMMAGLGTTLVVAIRALGG